MDTKGLDIRGLENKGIAELFQYWNRLRDGRAAPKRNEIEPMDIRGHLADTFILENGLRLDATFRLAGTRVCAVFGRELKNFTFYSLFDPSDLSMMRRLIQSCFKDKSISVITFEGTSKDRRSMTFDCIFLPLDGDGGSERLFGAMFAREKPFWLGADIIEECKVSSVRVIDPAKDYLSIASRPNVAVPSMRPAIHELHARLENDGDFTPSARRIGHLTVIPGGRT